MKLYPTGDVINHARYGKIAVYAENTQKAVESATDFIGRNIGMASVFMPPAQNFSQESSAAGTGIVNNIYYVDNDKRSLRPVPHPARPGHKPGTPAVRPEQKPDRPGHKPGTPAVRPEQKPDRPGKKPAVPAVRPEQKPDHPGQKPASPSDRPEQKPAAPGSAKPENPKPNGRKDQKNSTWNWVPEWGTPGTGINDKRR